MKKFMLTVLGVSALFVGIGGVFEKASAIFETDDKALIMLKKSPIESDCATKINLVNRVSTNENAIKIFQIQGDEKLRESSSEMLPNQIGKIVEMRVENGLMRQVNPEDICKEHVLIVKRSDKNLANAKN